MENERRHFLAATAIIGIGTLVSTDQQEPMTSRRKLTKKGRGGCGWRRRLDAWEHGVPNRICLSPKKGCDGFGSERTYRPPHFTSQPCHERLEECFIFPEFERRKKLVDLVQGWCPPISFFRRRGFRMASEIDCERYALKALRGDFRNVLAAHDRGSGNGVQQALQAVKR